MKLNTFQKRNRIGSALVFLQFIALFLLLSLTLATTKTRYGTIPMEALTMACASLLLATWTLKHNRPCNFNLSPLPKLWCNFVNTGPYQWIRHPMYTSLLLGTGGLALASSPFFGWMAWSVLAFILMLTSIFEERWMREKHPQYSFYSRHSYRFIPWVF